MTQEQFEKTCHRVMDDLLNLEDAAQRTDIFRNRDAAVFVLCMLRDAREHVNLIRLESRP